MHELFRALAVLAEPPAPQTALVAASLGIDGEIDSAAYTGLFVLSLYPYASVYLGAEGMLGGEARDRIAGFWRAMGSEPPAEPDHLSVLLGAYASLIERESAAPDAPSREAWRHARRAFLFEHVLSWLPAYLHKLGEIAPPPYAQWGAALRAALQATAREFEAPAGASLHHRETLGIADPRAESVAEFVASLLAPARSGMIFTPQDFARAARDLGLGLRYGERRFVLESLFGQDPQRMLDWLAREADRWAILHQTAHLDAGTSARWVARAEDSAALLRELEEPALLRSP